MQYKDGHGQYICKAWELYLSIRVTNNDLRIWLIHQVHVINGHKNDNKLNTDGVVCKRKRAGRNRMEVDMVLRWPYFGQAH